MQRGRCGGAERVGLGHDLRLAEWGRAGVFVKLVLWQHGASAARKPGSSGYTERNGAIVGSMK